MANCPMKEEEEEEEKRAEREILSFFIMNERGLDHAVALFK